MNTEKNYETVDKVKEVLSHITYKNWWFIVETKNDGFYLQIAFMGPDADDSGGGRVIEQHGRKWLISPYMTKNELIQTAFKAILTAEEHEVRENFMYNGKRILGPHIDVDVLWKVCDKVDVRENPKSYSVYDDYEDDIEADWPPPPFEEEEPHGGRKRRRVVMLSQ